MEPGEHVGKYEIVSLLGEGGFASVYRVRHAILGSDHALKVLRRELLGIDEVRERFLDEARVQAQLHHPGIVRVTDLLAEPGVAGFVMEFVEGESLGDVIAERAERRSPPTPDEVRAVFLPVLDAVQFAHGKGVVHRDLKPDNILLATDHAGRLAPKVTDFGIAKVAGELRGKRKTTLGARTLGTLGYMSPEQLVSSRDVDARTDVFSLAVAMLEFATLSSPFERDSEFETMKAVDEVDFVIPERLRSEDPVLVEVIERALRKDPEERWASCAAMGAALAKAKPAKAKLAKAKAKPKPVAKAKPVARPKPKPAPAPRPAAAPKPPPPPPTAPAPAQVQIVEPEAPPPDDDDGRAARAVIGGIIGFFVGLPAGGIGALPGAFLGALIGVWLPEIVGCAVIGALGAAVVAVLVVMADGGC